MEECVDKLERITANFSEEESEVEKIEEEESDEESSSEMEESEEVDESDASVDKFVLGCEVASDKIVPRDFGLHDSLKRASRESSECSYS